MTKKERFLQLTQTILTAIAPFRGGGMRASADLAIGTMEFAQLVEEDCIPDDHLAEAATAFVAYCDPEYSHCINGDKNPQRPAWLQRED